MTTTVTLNEWRRASGRTFKGLAEELGITDRSLYRYVSGEFPWPFALVVRLKKIAGGVLTDRSFVVPAARHDSRKRKATSPSVSRA